MARQYSLLGSTRFNYKNKQVLAIPYTDKSLISIIDLESWQKIADIKKQGLNSYIYNHKNSPYLWMSSNGKGNKGCLYLVNKTDLKEIKKIKIKEGNQVSHITFSRSGQRAVVVIIGKESGIRIFDTKTVKEIKRIRIDEPSAIYSLDNVYGKIK